jgi:hypothetical protein
MDYNKVNLDLPNHNYLMGIIGGILGAIAGAIVWALITGVTGYQIGWVAIGVGYVVGKSVSYFGNGEHTNFRIIGVVFALLGCLLGNLIAVAIIISDYYGISLLEFIALMNFRMIIDLFVDTFEVMDLFFYGLAIYQGYKVSVKNVTSKEIEDSSKTA